MDDAWLTAMGLLHERMATDWWSLLASLRCAAEAAISADILEAPAGYHRSLISVFALGDGSRAMEVRPAKGVSEGQSTSCTCLLASSRRSCQLEAEPFTC